MLALIDAAHEMGFQAEAAKLTVGRLTDMTLPCILHWNQNHFVVLYKVKGERLFYIADPAKGKTVFTIDRESIIPDGTTGREALFADNGCRIMEVVLGEGNAFVEQNDLSTFLYGNLYANSLHFSSVGFEALQNIFRLSTISDKTMECIGWPTAQLQQADPKAVRALYRIECITDSITQP